jgi:hypothetical protein
MRRQKDETRKTDSWEQGILDERKDINVFDELKWNTQQ